MPILKALFQQKTEKRGGRTRTQWDEAQVLLSLARGGLRLAAGDPGTRGSLASQIGSAFEPTAAEIAALRHSPKTVECIAVRAQDRELRASSLQAALGIEENALAARQALSLAQAKARSDILTRGRDERVVLDSQGNNRRFKY